MKKSFCVIWQFIASTLLMTAVTVAQSPQEGSRLTNWPRFQGGGNVAVADDSLPTRWSPNENIAWQSPIEGYGQSTPVVFNGQIYVTSVSGPQREQYHLTAFRLDNGDTIWQRDFDNPTPAENTPMTSRAAPSAVADSEGCTAFFEGGIVAAVDRQGDVRWQRNLIQDYGTATARHGFAASLEQDDERVFVWVERSESPYVLALDKASGRTVWKVDGVGATSWASPRLIPIDGRPQLVCSASGKIIALDPATGERLWEFTDIANNTSCTPIPIGDNRFLIGASDGRGEQTAAGAVFNGVIEVKRDGDDYNAEFVWRANKASSTFGSPVAAAGTAWIVNRAGVLYGLDLETGERVSVNRMGAGGIWATPIVSKDHLYLFGYKGTTSVISLPEGKEIAENRLWDEQADQSFGRGRVLYAAAPVPPYLILRSGDQLFAIEESR